LSQSATGTLEVEDTIVVELASWAAAEIDIEVDDEPEPVVGFDDGAVTETAVEVDDVFVGGVDAGVTVTLEGVDEGLAAPGLIAKTTDPGLLPSAQISPPSKR